MEPIQIAEKTVKSYEIRNNGEWGTVVVETSEGYARVMAHTSFGEYGYTWIAPGKDALAFLKKIDFDYTMGKFRGNYEVFDQTAHLEYLNNKIKELKHGDEAYYLEEARQICFEASDSNTFMLILGGSELFELLFAADYSEVEVKTMPDPQCVGFWEKIWTPLISKL